MASRVPRHVAIVLDGNRRYAKKLGLHPWKGHEFGLRKLEDLFSWCMELGIRELTLYCFSTENFKRTKNEIDYLCGLFWEEFNKIKKGKGIFKDKVRVKPMGRLNMFSGKMRKAMLEAAEKTRKNKKLVVNLALAYGARQEITDAFRQIVKNHKNPKINERLIAENLYLKSEPDMLIRPGGEKRMSNFLLWQASYSELFFIDKLWPEFTKKDLVECIRDFSKRQRRFGK